MLEASKWIRDIQAAIEKIPQERRNRILQLVMELNNMENKIETDIVVDASKPAPRPRGRPRKDSNPAAIAAAMKVLGTVTDEQK